MPQPLSELPASILRLLLEHPVARSLRRRPRVFPDTSDFTSIDYGDVIVVDSRYFLVTGYTKEGRFGVDEQPKQWVPRVQDLETGERHILKLVFYENFTITMGEYQVECFRNPEKEARILELVHGRLHFMQGYAALDQGNNLVRILDIIQGRRLDKHIFRRECSHQEYFEQELPPILSQFLECAQAISLLHAHGLRHGDIRRDHIFVEYDTGIFKWIDFDYDFYLPERPFALDIFELGNVLLFLAGRGHYQGRDILAHPEMGNRILTTITAEDASLVSKSRVVNLRKLFPYIPERLNHIFMHFSAGANVFYDTVDEFCQELSDCLEDML